MKEYYLLRRDRVLDAFGVTSHGHTTDQAGVGCINGQAPLFCYIDFYELVEKIFHRNA